MTWKPITEYFDHDSYDFWNRWKVYVFSPVSTVLKASYGYEDENTEGECWGEWHDADGNTISEPDYFWDGDEP